MKTAFKHFRIYLTLSFVIILVAATFVISQVRESALQNPTQALTICDSERKENIANAVVIPVKENSANSTANTRFASNVYTKTLPNVFLNPNDSTSTNKFFLSANNERPNASNLIDTGFSIDDAYVLSMIRTRDENNVVLPAPEYYSSLLVNFLNIRHSYTTPPNDTNLPRQLIIYDGKDNLISDVDRHQEGVHNYQNKIKIDNETFYPAEPDNTIYSEYSYRGIVLESGGGDVGLRGGPSQPIGEKSIADNEAHPIGKTFTARELGITLSDPGFNPDTEKLRKILTDNRGTSRTDDDTATLFFPYDFKKKMRVEDMQPRKFVKLPTSYKNVDDMLGYISTPSNVVSESQLPKGLYNVTFDLYDTGGNAVRNAPIFFNYTQRNPDCNPAPPTPTPPQCVNSNVMLTLDASTSMGASFPDYGSRVEALKDITIDFVTKLDFQKTYAGAVTFSSEANVIAEWGSSKNKIISEIVGYNLVGPTRTDLGIEASRNELNKSATGSRKFLILITDGVSTSGTEAQALQAAENARNAGITLIGLFIGNDEEGKGKATLQSMVSQPASDNFYTATDAAQLQSFFNNLSTKVECSSTPQTPLPSLKALTFLCSSTGFGNPYKVRGIIRSTVGGGLRVEENAIVLSPHGTNAGGFSHPSAGNATTVVLNSTNPSRNVSGQYSTSGSFSSGSTATFDFQIDFAPGSNFFNNFVAPSTSNAIDVYYYIRTNSPNTAQNNNLIQPGNIMPVFVGSFNPIENCLDFNYTTSSGDFRSYEPGAYAGNASSPVSYTNSGNKFWRTENATQTDFEDSDNTPSGTRNSYKTSNFLFEAPNSLRNSSSNGDGFRLPVDNAVHINREQSILKPMVTQNLPKAVATGELKKVIVNQANSSGNGINIGGTNVFASPPRLSINLANVPQSNIFFEISYFGEVNIEDSDTAPKNIVIWCKTKSCKLNVKGVRTISTTSTNQFNYDSTSIKSLLQSQSRIYLNYDVQEDASTPVAEETYVDGKNIKTRLITFDASNTNANNLYLGAFLTNGFVRTSTSRRTDIVKGFIISRGVILYASSQSNKDTYFKDYLMPFLHIDFDPKYYLVYGKIFGGGNSVPKYEYVGL